MKDHIPGSEEFLIRYYDLLETELRSCLPKNPIPILNPSQHGTPPPSEVDNTPPSSPATSSPARSPPAPQPQPHPILDDVEGDVDRFRNPMDTGLTVHNPTTGRTDLHFVNNLIKKIGTLHNEIDKTSRLKKEEYLINMSKRQYYLHKEIKKISTPQEMQQQYQEEFNNLQRDLRIESKVKEKAKQLRIQNFYKSKNGKLNATSFYSVKEKQPPRTIKEILHNGQSITDPENIITIMQEWYGNTASQEWEQVETLEDMLGDLHLDLPQISPEIRELLDEEISSPEVEVAINEAHEVSAPGPTGQTITLYKLLFQEIPDIFTSAINQLVFNPELASHSMFQWIKERKVIYIPEKPLPATPGDYRPLSMLEVLYKIPSRILARRLTTALPDIIGEHQHGFMQGKAIQEPSLLATHLIQDSQQTNRPLQLVSLDIEKAFDRIGHKVIVQALRAFGVPELLIQALCHYTLVGYAQVEVNGRKGILITIKTGSGQGDPLSSILFLIGSEPLNRLIASSFPNLMYVTREGVRVGPVIFADDNLSPLSLTRADQITPILDLYNRYTGVSGLNINVRKSTILGVNCTQELLQDLQTQGFSTPPTIRHLGVELGLSIQNTIKETINKIDLKATKRRILATAPLTDILHRATLIDSALTPLYNHVLMALPVTEEDLQPLYKEIKSFLWTRTENETTIQKR
jgi:hypothetical protein